MESKHLLFKEQIDFAQQHKTHKYDIISKSDSTLLGQVKWNPQWRQYCFYPEIEYETQWSQDCLEDLSLFIMELKEERERCKKCGHPKHIHINADEGYRCHGINYDDTIKDSVQCECRLK